MHISSIFPLLVATALGCSSAVTPTLAPDTSVGGDAGRTTDAGLPDLDSGATAAEAGLDGGLPPPDAGPFKPAPHVLPPVIPKGGPALLKPVRVVTVVTAGDPLASHLQAFGDALVTSQWFTTVGAEYGLGGAGPHVFLTGPVMAAGTPVNPAGLSQAQAVAYLEGVVNANASAAPDGRSVYMLYLPDGVAISYGGPPNAACNQAVGYHEHAPWSSMADDYAVVQRCPTIDPNEEAPQDLLTRVASHEILEAATDPYPFNATGYEGVVPTGEQAWQENVWLEIEGLYSAELGDYCIPSRVVEGSFTYQRIFSNAAATAGGAPCIPVSPAPYFNVTESKGWYAVAAGADVTITLTGWSTAARGDWMTYVVANNSRSSIAYKMTATLTSATTQTLAGTTYPTTNNGLTVSLTAHMPAGAPKGWWATLSVGSFDAAPNGYTPPGEDFEEDWLVGVYVP